MSDYISWRWARRAAVIAPLAVLFAALSAFAFFHGGLRPAWATTCRRLRPHYVAAQKALGFGDGATSSASLGARNSALWEEAPVGLGKGAGFGASAAAGSPGGGDSGGRSGSRPTLMERLRVALSLRLPAVLGGFTFGAALGALLAVLGLGLVVWFVLTFCRLQVSALMQRGGSTTFASALIRLGLRLVSCVSGVGRGAVVCIDIQVAGGCFPCDCYS